MKLNPKVTGALAWTGLVVILAVPSAEMLVGKPEAQSTLTADMDQVQTAGVKPVVVQPVAPTGDVVQDFINSGKKKPSYISDGDEPAAPAAPVAIVPVKKPGTITVNPDGTLAKPAAPATVAVAPVPDVVPFPLPASARPKPKPATEAPLIIEENEFASVQPAPAPEGIFVPDEQLVTGEELEEWDSGSLADYLAQKGLLDNSAEADTNYDDVDAFLIGPAPERRSRVIIEDDDGFFF